MKSYNVILGVALLLGSSCLAYADDSGNQQANNSAAASQIIKLTNASYTASLWMNQCVEEVPQSNYGMVYQTNTDTGQQIRTNVMCDPYGATVPAVPAPN